jgi:predicted nucleic acid-binding protein
MKNLIIADTGFWYALINEDDYFHVQAVTALRNIDGELISTWPVITETSYLLQSRLGLRQVCEFLAAYHEGLFSGYELNPEQLLRVTELMKKYADLPMDLADASLVVLAEELGHGRILSTDMRDFTTYRWKNHHPFQNILLPDY